MILQTKQLTLKKLLKAEEPFIHELRDPFWQDEKMSMLLLLLHGVAISNLFTFCSILCCVINN